MFRGRRLLIATKHGKEKVIAPILEKELGVKCFVDSGFNTDVFGTFTGEIDRINDPITTVRNKCLMAMELNNCDLAIASEGSFGSHPAIFFLPADDEKLFFIDKRNELEIIVNEISLETNFNGSDIFDERQLMGFAEAAKFPSHGLIIRKAKTDYSEIYKGILDWKTLSEAFNHFISTYGMAYVETDMRALYNPSRMKVIENATRTLVAKINSLCPECSTPGFGITSKRQGLPCSFCGSPTRSTLSYIYTCIKCTFSKVEMYPHNKTCEEPTYCDVCNP